MTPTPKLRYVEREVRIPICEGMARCEYHQFLQQWWEDRNMRLAVMKHDKYGIPIPCYQGEWRDVPLEKE